MAPVLSLDMGRDRFKAFLTDVVGISSDVVGDFCINQVQCAAKSKFRGEIGATLPSLEGVRVYRLRV